MADHRLVATSPINQGVRRLTISRHEAQKPEVDQPEIRASFAPGCSDLLVFWWRSILSPTRVYATSITLEIERLPQSRRGRRGSEVQGLQWANTLFIDAAPMNEIRNKGIPPPCFSASLRPPR